MSILARLVILVLVALVPTIAAHAINEILLYRDLEREMRHTVLTNAQVRNSEMDGIVSGIQHLLGAIGRLPAVASLDRSSCSQQLETMTNEYPRDVVLTVADVKGAVHCSSLPRHHGAELANRVIFDDVINTGEFRVGGYVANPITSAKAISFGYPIRDDAGELTGVMIAYLNLDWLVSDLQQAPFLPGRTLILADRNGVVLAQAPGREFGGGQQLAAPLLAMIRAAAPGIAEIRDMQGRPVLYGYVPITVPPPNIYILYGIEKDTAFAPIYHAVWRSAVLSLLSILGALIIAWIVGVKSIRRPVQRLLDAAQSWRRGDYSARANLRGLSSEVLDLGLACDSMAERLLLREQQLASANRIKDIILAAAGHDLRQPLQIISMTISALSRKPLVDRERQHVERANKAVEQLVDALDALIEASRVQYGTARPQRERFTLDCLLQDVVEQWSTKATEKGLRLRVRECNAVIDSDPSMLATILRNLVGNAIKYTDNGGVLVGCRRRGAELWIEIYDTGIGIPEDEVNTIFGDFHQLDAKREGLGLGLWIAHSAAEALGHTLSVRSVVGKGSRFRVAVPLATVSSALHASGHVNEGTTRF